MEVYHVGNATRSLVCTSTFNLLTADLLGCVGFAAGMLTWHDHWSASTRSGPLDMRKWGPCRRQVAVLTTGRGRVRRPGDRADRHPDWSFSEYLVGRAVLGRSDVITATTFRRQQARTPHLAPLRNGDYIPSIGGLTTLRQHPLMPHSVQLPPRGHLASARSLLCLGMDGALPPLRWYRPPSAADSDVTRA